MAARRPIVLGSGGYLREIPDSDSCLVPHLSVGGSTAIDGSRVGDFTGINVDELSLDGDDIGVAAGDLNLFCQDRVHVHRTGSNYPLLALGTDSATYGTIQYGYGAHSNIKLWQSIIDFDFDRTESSNHLYFRYGRGVVANAGLSSIWYRGKNTAHEAMRLDHDRGWLWLNRSNQGAGGHAGLEIHSISGYQARISIYEGTSEKWTAYYAHGAAPLKLWDGAGSRDAITVNSGGTVDTAGRLKAGTTDTLRRLISLPSALGVGAWSFANGIWSITPGNFAALWLSLDLSVGTKITSARVRAHTATELASWRLDVRVYSIGTDGTLTSRFYGTVTRAISGAFTVDATGTAYTVADGVPLVMKIETVFTGDTPNAALTAVGAELLLQEQVV